MSFSSHNIGSNGASTSLALSASDVEIATPAIDPATIAQHYHGLVDIGSNGVRFSISNLSPPTARLMPTVYQDRSAISLYDAQHDANGNMAPVPDAVIRELVAALVRFKVICQQHGVSPDKIKLVATEATRNAQNRDYLLSQIERATGWLVILLSKEEEGAFGAMGMASSVESINGICIDMGGGSLQMTAIVTDPDGETHLGPSVSHPYGAAALMNDLKPTDELESMDLLPLMVTKFKDTMDQYLLNPRVREVTDQAGGIELYLSGGGFRGLGHLLMSQERNWQHYPIPFVNGYTVDEATFFSTASSHNEHHDGTESHRISARRASQIPAVQLVVEALLRTEIKFSKVTFVQGGVREGSMYKDLPLATRAIPPILAATCSLRPFSADGLCYLMRDIIPLDHMRDPLLEAIVNLLYAHASLNKDVRAVAALRSTTVGLLNPFPGLSHYDRAMLALVLCERWGGSIPAADVQFHDDLAKICGPRMRWYAKFVGRIAKGIASLYPIGVIEKDKFSLAASYTPTTSDAAPEKSEPPTKHCTVDINLLVGDANDKSLVAAWKADLEKLSKRKQWGKDPKWGLEVEVRTTAISNGVHHA